MIKEDAYKSSYGPFGMMTVFFREVEIKQIIKQEFLTNRREKVYCWVYDNPRHEQINEIYKNVSKMICCHFQRNRGMELDEDGCNCYADYEVCNEKDWYEIRIKGERKPNFYEKMGFKYKMIKEWITKRLS